jgi:hypothetical protein
MHVVGHDDVPSYAPTVGHAPCGNQEVVYALVVQNRGAVFRANCQEDNDRSIFSLHNGRVGRPFSAGFGYA